MIGKSIRSSTIDVDMIDGGDRGFVFIIGVYPIGDGGW